MCSLTLLSAVVVYLFRCLSVFYTDSCGLIPRIHILLGIILAKLGLMTCVKRKSQFWRSLALRSLGVLFRRRMKIETQTSNMSIFYYRNTRKERFLKSCSPWSAVEKCNIACKEKCCFVSSNMWQTHQIRVTRHYNISNVHFYFNNYITYRLLTQQWGILKLSVWNMFIIFLHQWCCSTENKW